MDRRTSRKSAKSRPISIMATLVTLLISAGAAMAAPEVRTEKPMYELNEPITIQFSDAPAPASDMLTVAPAGSPDVTSYGFEALRGMASGSKVLRLTLTPGRYEARIFQGQTAKVVARSVFAVGQNCFKPPGDGPKPCEPAVRTGKKDYAPSEPIDVVFEGSPGHGIIWLTVMQKLADGTYQPPKGTKPFPMAPDREQKPWHHVQSDLFGTRIFDGLPAGEYEVQFRVTSPYTATTEAIAQAGFAVVDGLRSAQLTLQDKPAQTSAAVSPGKSSPGLPEPGLEGSWLGHITCLVQKTRQGDVTSTYNAILQISRQPQVQAELFMLWGPGQSIAFRLSGEHDAASGNVSLKAREWIYQPSGAAQPFDLKMRLEGSGLRITGEVSNIAGCTEWQAVKFRRDERPAHDRGIVTAWQKYQATLANKDSCIPFMTWVADGGVIPIQGTEIPTRVLDTEDFYQVMGKPYDTWSEGDLSAYRAFLGACISTFQRSPEIAVSSLVQRAMRAQALGNFLGSAPPSRQGANHSQHFYFLANYARVVSIRNARHYADLQTNEAKALSNSAENFKKLDGEISAVSSGKGVFVALPEQDRKDRAASLTALKQAMGGALGEAEFAKFTIASYPQDLTGLRRAGGDRQTLETSASTYLTPAQATSLRQKFDAAISPLSRAVADQIIAQTPRIDSSVDGVLRGKAQTAELERDALPYLSTADRTRVTQAYEQRNAKAAGELLPQFPAWLSNQISPDERGKDSLAKLSRDMFGRPPEQLNANFVNSLGQPYSGLASAISNRGEQLKFEICALPQGFQELRTVLCPEAARR